MKLTAIFNNRKKQFLYVFYSIIILLVFKYTIFNNSQHSNLNSKTTNEAVVEKQDTIYKDTIMPLMPDLAKKQELGRHAWYLFHTTLSRYPDEPTTEQQTKLKNYIELFAEFYPCGECSYHFQQLLFKNPIQVKSRQTAALWGCHLHNLVNEHLKKDIYDCTTILEDYDCGCGEFSEFNNESEKSEKSKITINKEEKQQG
ncbi:hypothetical protein QEN19_003301 [Hanseniaspora menglaensis]